MRERSLPKQSFNNNSLNAFRLIAAFNVMFDHAFVHLKIPLGTHFGGLLKLFENFTLGVPIFFFLTGYLILQSVKNENNAALYFKKRFVRIYPELWVAVIISILSIIIFYENCDYFDLIKLMIAQGTFFQFWTPDSLRGFGNGAPNGSLWTICVFIQFYIIAWLFRKKYQNRKKSFWILLFGGGILASIVTLKMKLVLPDILYKLLRETLIPYAWIFILGMAVSEFSNYIIPFLKKYWYAFLSFSVFWYIGLRFFNFKDIWLSYPLIKSSILCLTMLGIAYRFPRLKCKRDISYGVYCFHMIVINILIEVNAVGTMNSLFIIIIVSCIMGWASSYLPDIVRRKVMK